MATVIEPVTMSRVDISTSSQGQLAEESSTERPLPSVSRTGFRKTQQEQFFEFRLCTHQPVSLAHLMDGEH